MISFFYIVLSQKDFSFVLFHPKKGEKTPKCSFRVTEIEKNKRMGFTETGDDN